MKTLQGLRKRTGAISYVGSGPKLTDHRPLKVGEVVTLYHENGAEIVVSVDVVQKEGTLLGKVLQLRNDVPGVAVGEGVVCNPDFVFVINRADKYVDLRTVPKIARSQAARNRCESAVCCVRRATIDPQDFQRFAVFRPMSHRRR